MEPATFWRQSLVDTAAHRPQTLTQEWHESNDIDCGVFDAVTNDSIQVADACSGRIRLERHRHRFGVEPSRIHLGVPFNRLSDIATGNLLASQFGLQ
jgi:hypothetical protein